jgi:predicted RNase H-like HicB family nuclease
MNRRGDTEEDLMKDMTEAFLLVLEWIEKREKNQKGRITTLPITL